MAALGSRLVTLADVAKSKDKQIGKVAEVLTQINPMLQDIPYMEMNEGTVHKEEIRSGLPDVYYRKANQPIPASKTGTEERSYTAAHFESKSQIDDAVARRGGADRIAYNRWNQAQGHLQAHAQEHASLTVYGSPDDDARKTAGFFDVYSTLTATEPTSKQMIVGGGEGADNTSILLSFWGERGIFGIYPRGTQAGLKRTDHSKGGKLVQIHGTDENGAAGTFWGWEEQFEIDHGLVIKDYRQGARICNIEVSALIADASEGADIIDLMISAFHKINNPEDGMGVWYVNRTVEAFLHKQALSKVSTGSGLTFENYEGKRILSFLGIPIKRSDAILNTEATVS